MPASMISAVTGSKLKVIGSSSAIVAVGPMPGSTPTAVPSATPRRQKKRFSRRSAVSMPRPRLSNSSIGRLHRDPVADQRQAQLERHDEDENRDNGQSSRDRERLQHRRAGATERGEQGRTEQCADDAEAADGEPEEQQGRGDEDDRPPVDAGEALAVAADEALYDDRDAERGRQEAERQGHVSGAHAQ